VLKVQQSSKLLKLPTAACDLDRITGKLSLLRTCLIPSGLFVGDAVDGDKDPFCE